MAESGGPPPGPSPQYSPDGRWWWDGQRWVPVPTAPPPPGVPRTSPFMSGFAGCFGVLVAVVVVILVIVAITSALSNH